MVLDDTNEAIISDELRRCKRSNGFLVVAPQHRNSLLLKQYDHEVFVDSLKLPTRDIIDESDAILHYNFQLVYALGEQVPLPDGPSRWSAMEALILMMSEGDYEALFDPEFTHRAKVRSGLFPQLRLLQPFFADETKRRELSRLLCSQLVCDPPYEFRWMKLINDDEKRNVLIKVLCQPEVGAEEAINCCPLFGKYKQDVLAIRGCIAHGLLFHAMQARHRVNYGLSCTSGKKLAVPFSASDTPKDRSEFSHPDMAILYSTLAYFHTGLSLEQFKNALELLLDQGPTAQRVIYREWINSIANGVEDGSLRKFDSIEKIDLSNKVQLSSMHQCLGGSMRTIVYWMNHFLFPNETYQFPLKRATSAWNLVDDKSIGFSGTDDTKKILPLAVQQKDVHVEQLRGTNGMMIDLIMSCTNETVYVLDNDDSAIMLWKGVLQLCLAQSTDALIDVGGLMAGTTPASVAQYLVPLLKASKHRGVVYYNALTNRWHVLESESKRDLALRSSSLKESECFVYFDESRCRGADMKLNLEAKALVTLEPKMTKDKFLQGCARMRKLGRNQQGLILAGTSEVVSKNSSVKGILEMIVHNTVMMIRQALPMFYDHGCYFFKFPSPLHIPLTLDELYKKPHHEYSDFLVYIDAHAVTEVETESSECKKLTSYCKEIGQGLSVHSGGVNQECERELEEELEEEEQQEIQIIQKNPFSQVAWDFSLATSSSYTSLFGSVFRRLTKIVKLRLPDLKRIRWSNDLYVTDNFWKTIQDSASSPDMSSYLRLVNSMLVFQDGRVVLVSLYELDQLLPHWWEASFRSRSPCFIEQLSRIGQSGKPRFGFSHNSLSIEVTTSIKLFCGMVDYSEEEKEVLKVMLADVPRPRRTIEKLSMKRHQHLYFERSDLEEFCDSISSS